MTFIASMTLLNLLQNHSMLFTSTNQTLRIAALSEDSRLRQQAIQHLRQLHVNGSSFLSQLLNFIIMGDREIHILAYTYLLNQWILGPQRLALDLMLSLQNTYLLLMDKEIEEVTFNYQNTKFRVQNLIRLAVAFLIKPQHILSTKNFLKKIGLEAFQEKSKRLRQFHTKILQGMNESIDNTIRSMIGAELNHLLSQILNSLWQQDEQQMLFVVETSYYLAFLDAKLYQAMVELIGRIHGQHPLLWKIIERIKVALSENRFNPPIQLSLMTYRRIKLLLGSINISNIRSYARDRQFFWSIAQRMRNIVDIISGLLGSMYRRNLTEKDQQQIHQTIINRNEYQILVSCLIEISYQFQSDDEDQQIDNLKKSITQLMQQLNDRMRQQDIYNFYQTIRNNIDSGNALKIITFLSGASMHILQLFDCENVIKRMVNYEFQIPLSGSLMYYLFLGRYLRMNIYFIDQVLLQDIYEFILRHVDLQETALSESHQERATSHHLLKISQLMLIAAESVNIPWTRFYQNYLPMIVKKIFYYLANSFLGVPQAARENLLQAMLSIVSKKIAPLNTSITASLVDIYSDCFLERKEFDLKTHRLTCKVQQQFLQILTQSITEQSVLDQEIRTRLIFVMNCVPEMDEVIIKELTSLIFSFMRLYNLRLVKMNEQELQKLTLESFPLPFGHLGTFLLSSLKVENFQQCISLLSNKYGQMFVNRVKQLLQNYHCAVLLLLELSLYPSYYRFVDFMMIQMIKHLQKFHQTCVKLGKAVGSHPSEIKLAFLELVKIKQLANCLLEAMHLNPLWRSNKFTSQNKLSISSSQSFSYCKQNINNLFSFLVTEMMNQVSLQHSKVSKDTWSKRYGMLLHQSTAKLVIDKWLITYENY